MHESPQLTVLVPTFNRAASLDRLLKSLRAAQQAGGCRFEVLIIDNGSTDNTRSLVGAQPDLPVRCLEETRRGKAHALNLGLRHARGGTILVLDDDVVVHRECLAQHLRAHATTAFDALQGKILPGTDPSGAGAELARLREYNIPYIDYGEQIRPVRGLTGTNMSFKRAVCETVGFFDTRLGPGAAGFSEDTEFSMRIRKAGFQIGYTPHAVVYHELNPNRYGREYHRMVEFRKGMSRSIYRHDSIALRVLPDLLANCGRYGIYRLLGKSQKAYKTEGRIWKSWGYLMGKMRRVKSPGGAGQA